jgi:hypothetical protein
MSKISLLTNLRNVSKSSTLVKMLTQTSQRNRQLATRLGVASTGIALTSLYYQQAYRF